MTKLFQWLSGRTTAFLVGFFIIGNTAFFLRMLDATFISFMVTFMGLTITHSFKDDKHEQAMKDSPKTQGEG